MNLRERLLADLQDAMRNRDERRKAAIRMVRAAVANAEIDLHRDCTDVEIQDIIAKEVKRRVEALELFRQARRDDLITKEETELEILNGYLPKQLSREDVERAVRAIAEELGASGPAQLGAVMRQAMAQLKGQADGRLINEVARAILSAEH